MVGLAYLAHNAGLPDLTGCENAFPRESDVTAAGCTWLAQLAGSRDDRRILCLSVHQTEPTGEELRALCVDAVAGVPATFGSGLQIQQRGACDRE